MPTATLRLFLDTHLPWAQLCFRIWASRTPPWSSIRIRGFRLMNAISLHWSPGKIPYLSPLQHPFLLDTDSLRKLVIAWLMTELTRPPPRVIVRRLSTSRQHRLAPPVRSDRDRARRHPLCIRRL